MNTKSRNFSVAPEFENLFAFSSKEEKLEHRAQMISYRILSEVEKICEEKKIKMKDLAKMVETSASYITQLFRGNKQVNTTFMARFEEVMNMCFEFTIRQEMELLDEIANAEMSYELIEKLHKQNPGASHYIVHKGVKKVDSKVKRLLEASAQEDFSKLSA